MNIIFRLDSGNIIGTGHVQRCLNLANQFDNEYNISFICKSFKGNLIDKIREKYKVIEIEGKDDNMNINTRESWLGEYWKLDARKTIKVLKTFDKVDLLIIDHYGIPSEWEKTVLPYVKKLFVIDDVDRSHHCHILQNQHITAKYKDVNEDCDQLLGSEYVILNKDIANIVPQKIEALKRINVSLGGADDSNETMKILKTISNLDFDIQYDVVIGKANRHIQEIQEFCQNNKKINIYVDLPNEEFLNLLNRSDLCIGAAGLTNYERCILNRPTFYIQIVENQQKLVERLQESKIGLYLGNTGDNYSMKLRNQIIKCYHDSEYLRALAKNCNQFCNVGNIYKVKNILESYMSRDESKLKLEVDLAINGGTPVRSTILPYGKQTIDQDDIDAVVQVLKEDKFLTTGPRVAEFEETMCKLSNMKYGVACNSGTAALHMACHALNIGKGDEVIVPAISFAASSNCVLYCGGTPVFCDIEEDTMNIDVNKIEELITGKTKAIVAVDYAGQLCDGKKLREISHKHNLFIIEDAAHAVGQDEYYGDIVCQSYHPVKHLTTCEGGMSLTNNEEFAKRMRLFRTHGITRDFKDREINNDHYYEMVDIGYNYRIPDLLCALGISQANKLDGWIKKRKEIAEIYDGDFKKLDQYLEPLVNKKNNVYHLYVIKLTLENLKVDRDTIFEALKKEGLGVNVHYPVIYLHPYYQKLGYKKGLCPNAERIYEQIVTLPVFPGMNNQDVKDVIYIVNKIINFYMK